MKCRHQQVYILERKVEIPADEGICADAVVDVSSLSYSMICFQKIFDASFRPDVEYDGNEDVIQGL